MLALISGMKLSPPFSCQGNYLWQTFPSHAALP
jgi:hypothetical protein